MLTYSSLQDNPNPPDKSTLFAQKNKEMRLVVVALQYLLHCKIVSEMHRTEKQQEKLCTNCGNLWLP